MLCFVMVRPDVLLLTCVVFVVLGCAADSPPANENFDEAITEAAEASGVTWQSPIEVDEGDAYQGRWQMNDSDFRYVDAPSVALNSRNEANIAWVDQQEKALFFQRYDAEGAALLSERVDVSQSPDIFTWLPRIAVHPEDDDRVYLLWQDIVFSGGTHGGEIFFAHSTDGGASFSDPVNLSNTPAGAGKGRLMADHWHNGSLDIAVNENGDVFATWTEYEGTLWFSTSADGGNTFSEPLAVFDENEWPGRGPDVTVGPEGTIYLVWTVGEDSSSNVWLATSTDGGRSFSEPREVTDGSGHTDGAKLGVDSGGTLHLVYAESADGMLENYVLQYARSEDGVDTFSRPDTIIDPAEVGLASTNFPALAIDEADNLFVVWERFQQPRERPRGLGFTVSTDRGESFASASVVPGTDDEDLGINGSLQGLLMQKIAAGDEGQVVVVNSSFNPGERSVVRLMRGALE